MKGQLEKCRTKLTEAEHKIRILEDMIETRTRELYIKTLELERRNEELEQFAYVASHDLQEPLRTVTSFVTLLQQEYEDKLDANADKYIKFASEAANRMSQLIKDLLDFSRIGRDPEM